VPSAIEPLATPPESWTSASPIRVEVVGAVSKTVPLTVNDAVGVGVVIGVGVGVGAAVAAVVLSSLAHPLTASAHATAKAADSLYGIMKGFTALQYGPSALPESSDAATRARQLAFE